MERETTSMSRKDRIALAQVAARWALEEFTHEREERALAELHSVSQRVELLAEHASKRDDEIARLREGYDWRILKNFALRLIASIDTLAARIAAKGAQSDVAKELEVVRLELTFLLESNDVVEWLPETGSVVRDQLDRCEVVGTREDPYRGPGGIILEIHQPAFLFQPESGQHRVLRPAKVVVSAEQDGRD